MDQKKIQIMQEGGRKLSQIREQLVAAVKPGVTPLEIEGLANQLFDQSGGTPTFKKVPGYKWATCINRNDGIVHGIPNNIPFKEGDLVSIDLGLTYKGYITDTSATTVAGSPTPAQKKLIQAGIDALDAGINAARVGNKVSHISKAIESVIKAAGYTPVRELTGHGVGKRLHEDPYIPNFYDKHNPDSTLKDGQTIAIEPMYTTGGWKIKIDKDDWTIRTADGSLAGYVEHTIAITKAGPLILTK